MKVIAQMVPDHFGRSGCDLLSLLHKVSKDLPFFKRFFQRASVLYSIVERNRKGRGEK